MKILTDIGHPKNAHVLRIVVPLLQRQGHEIHFVYRDKEDTKSLCRHFGFSGLDRGKGGAGLAGKSFYLLKTAIRLHRLARSTKPDLLLSFGSPYLAVLAKASGIPMVVFVDTEQNSVVQSVFRRTAAAILVPSCFAKDLGKSQFRFQGIYELAYLHPKYFITDDNAVQELGLPAEENFVLLRTVAWLAVHDYRHHGFSESELESMVASFSGRARVFISAEGRLPAALEPYRLKILPHQIHHFMARASLVFSEGATMAAEAAVLGVPTIHCSDLQPGYIAELDKRHGLLRSFAHEDLPLALAAGMALLEDRGNVRQSLAKKRDALLAGSIDVARFIAWVIDRFPESADLLRSDPGYSLKFMK